MTTSNRPRLLSVEDNPETVILLKHLLHDSYETHFARSAEEGLKAIEEKNFDVLLLDINLRAKNGGIELLHRIREGRKAGGAPAIALTAYAMPGDRKKLLQAGFDGYVGKPFTEAELKEALRQALSNEEGQKKRS